MLHLKDGQFEARKTKRTAITFYNPEGISRMQILLKAVTFVAKIKTMRKTHTKRTKISTDSPILATRIKQCSIPLPNRYLSKRELYGVYLI